MEYIHIRSLEKYHPGYKDRTLQWGKIHFKMVQGDPDCELINNEIDWGRLIKMILLELEAQRPLPNIDSYWTKKGFDIKKRPMSLTIDMLHNFVEVIQDLTQDRHVEENKNKIKNKSEKGSNAQLSDFDFIQTLKTNPVYKGIDIDRELGKMDAYLLTKPGRHKTRRFVVAWLNRIDKPLLAEKKETKYKEVDKDCKACGGTGFIYNQSTSKNDFCGCRIKGGEK